MGWDLLFFPLAAVVAIASGRATQRLWDRRRTRRMAAAARRFGLRYSTFARGDHGPLPAPWPPRALPVSRVVEQVDGVLAGQRVFLCSLRSADKGGDSTAGAGRCRALVALELGERPMPEGLARALETSGSAPWLDAVERVGPWWFFWGRRPLVPELFARLTDVLSSLR